MVTRAGVRPVAGADHGAARERLLAQYAAIPAGAPVRLAKRTSNLFRPRSATATPGLDVSGLDRVLSVDPGARRAASTSRRSTACSRSTPWPAPPTSSA